MEQGYIQVYTGNGKGKTTAALGLAMRVAGAGFRVFVGQFVKGRDSSELHSFARLSDQIIIHQYGRPSFVFTSVAEEEVPARQGLVDIKDAVYGGKYKLVILDEVNVAVYLGLLPLEELLEIMDNRPPHVELVLTGRWADPRILEKADLVTEMNERKHYYRQGVLARTGIEK